MDIEVRCAEYADVEALRELYRHEAHCQIVHDSALSRGIADPYVILVDGGLAGYAGVWNRYYAGRVMEFYILPHMREFTRPLFDQLLAASHATHIEAQTNMPLMLNMLEDRARNIVEEKVLFEDGSHTRLRCPAGVFRRAAPRSHQEDEQPDGEWVIEVGGKIVATGGILDHYNPPYGDIYMEVSAPERRKGFGSYLVQELKRICYQAGKKPAARCDPSNIASRHTLERAGFLPCGELLAGEVRR